MSAGERRSLALVDLLGALLRFAGAFARAAGRFVWRWAGAERPAPRALTWGGWLISGACCAALLLVVEPEAGAALVTRTMPDGTTTVERRPVEQVDARATAQADEPERLARLGAAASDPAVRATLDAAAGSSSAGTPPGDCDELAALLAAPVVRLCAEIDDAASSQGLDPRVLAVLVNAECPYESDARCVSPVGAFGRAQLMPDTASSLQTQLGIPCRASHYDHPTNLACGALYYVQGLQQAADFWKEGRELTALLVAAAGYNAGHGRIPEARACASAGTPLEGCWSLPEETRDYVRKWRPLLEAAGYVDGGPVAVAR